MVQQYLTRKASRAVMDLLPEEAEGEFASVCSWADQVRFRYRWASPLHYINTPAGVCNFDYESKTKLISCRRRRNFNRLFQKLKLIANSRNRKKVKDSTFTKLQASVVDTCQLTIFFINKYKIFSCRIVGANH